MIRAGVIRNLRSRRNLEAAPAPSGAPEGVRVEIPRSLTELDAALARLASEPLDLLVVDGGDGTVRDVLTRAPAHFPQGLPTLAVLPSGKTNALAIDLRAPHGWTLEAALQSARAGRHVIRRPLEVVRAGATAPIARGFIFGAGAFVRATDLAQRTHKMGAFEGLAVGLTLGAAVFNTLFGGRRSAWRSGERMQLQFEGEPERSAPVFLLLASTLDRLPLGAEPFGPPAAAGVRTLTVDAPPQRLMSALPPLLAGGDPPWLERAGYHRRTIDRFGVNLETNFVLDGETYAGGAFCVRTGDPLQFVTP